MQMRQTDERTTLSTTNLVLLALAGAIVLLLVVMFTLLRQERAKQPTLVGWWETAPAKVTISAAEGVKPVASTAPLTPLRARVGLQVGHWHSEELPAELARLRSESGATSNGSNEIEVNLAIARQVTALLQQRGITVDLLPATIPPGYQADAFLAIHCDASNDPGISGFKLARFGDSTIPDRADALLNAITDTYGAATGQRRDPTISRAMIYYYAFNSDDFTHAISPQTPGAIIELGFLTNTADRTLLTTQQATLARALADGIIQYLVGR